jgi:hypothetical protein
MPTDDADPAARWRELANDVRLAAEQMNDPEARRSLLMIANSYDRIAQRAEAKAKEKKQPGT